MNIGKITGNRVVLGPAKRSDCTKEYLSWLEDARINQYLETRWEEQSIEKIQLFVESMEKSLDSILFVIIDVSSGRHIGNIKIGPINPNHKYADISYFIGDSNVWGKGYATEVVSLLTSYAFNCLDLENILAGVYESNIGSQRVLEKSGYKMQCEFSNMVVNVKNRRESLFRYTLSRGDFLARVVSKKT